jgi:hypothetical protein
MEAPPKSNDRRDNLACGGSRGFVEQSCCAPAARNDLEPRTEANCRDDIQENECDAMAKLQESRYRGVRLRTISDRRCFPFGQPVSARLPSATGPRAVFVLGVYPSGFHVAWWLPGREDRRTPDAKALIVDNEPEVFWDGAGAADLFERWRRDVGFVDHSWGRVALPEAGHNGPSGQWLRDKILAPLGHRRTDCWITDCLDTARLNAGQRRGSARHTCGSAAASGSPPRTWSRPRPARAASFGRRGAVTWSDCLKSWIRLGRS